MRQKVSKFPSEISDSGDVLLVHLGGLGDVCLAESVFYSLRRHFGDCLVALGNKRFLDLFRGYFKRTQGVESRHWLYLFSEKLSGASFRRIVFIGKDREGSVQRRWKTFSDENLIFIDMYPDDAFGVLPEGGCLPCAGGAQGTHIEDYQLAQLAPQGIGPLIKAVTANKSDRVILYPEEGFSKEKWPVDNFVSLFHSLKDQGVNVQMLRPSGLSLPVEGGLSFEGLSDVQEFFRKGGVFVSNDSGMAHLAGACGLLTLTIFCDFDPAVWHPRGRNVSLKLGVDKVDVGSVAIRLFRFLERVQKAH